MVEQVLSMILGPAMSKVKLHAKTLRPARNSDLIHVDGILTSLQFAPESRQSHLNKEQAATLACLFQRAWFEADCSRKIESHLQNCLRSCDGVSVKDLLYAVKSPRWSPGKPLEVNRCLLQCFRPGKGVKAVFSQ